MSTISAVSMATSVPAPMAMPMSARASAGASLMPSHHGHAARSARRRSGAPCPRAGRRRSSHLRPGCGTPAVRSVAGEHDGADAHGVEPSTAAGLVGFGVSATAIAQRFPVGGEEQGRLALGGQFFRLSGAPPLEMPSRPSCAGCRPARPPWFTAADMPSPGQRQSPDASVRRDLPLLGEDDGGGEGVLGGFFQGSGDASSSSSGMPGAGSTSVTRGFPGSRCPFCPARRCARVGRSPVPVRI